MKNDWMLRANCAGMSSELFFPDRVSRTLEREAIKVCEGCEVRVQCGNYAQTSNNGRRERFGIWNGKNHERKPRGPALTWSMVERVREKAS